MNVELTDVEALVIKMYIELAKDKSCDPEAKAGFELIIQKLQNKSSQ